MKSPQPLQLVHLYPKEMNLYGDTGNRLVLEKRLAWRNIPYQTHTISVGDSIPKNADVIIGGGGQDASQGAVERDFIKKAEQIYTLGEKGVVMLMVCGMYQLLGRRFLTSDGVEIKGAGILPVETLARPGRLIGNTVVDSKDAGQIVGYENHSGRTYLDEGASPLALVKKGFGNNDDRRTEGCRLNNIFATYMHGPILAKNPKLADLLLSLALEKSGVTKILEDLDDSLEMRAHEIASSRP